MKALVESLQRLKAEPAIIRQSLLASPLNAQKECARLVIARDQLQALSSTVRAAAPPLNPARVWEKFQSSGGDLRAFNDLELRTLCCTEGMAVQPSFVHALRSQPGRLKRSVCIYGMANSYFNQWRDMKAPEELEILLKEVIANYPRSNPVLDRWRATASLFSPQATERLAEFIVNRQSNVDAVLKQEYIGRTSRLALLTHARVAELASEHFRQIEVGSSEEFNLRYLEWVIKDVLTEALMPGAVHAATSSLILSQSADRSESFRQMLRSYVENSARLGDPRLRRSAPNWRGMAPEAEKVFLSWLARENILFFFNTILPGNDDNRRRADFWLRYYKQIKDFQVAISEHDFWKLNANKSAVDLPLHSRVAHASTSAFLMKFQGYGAEFIVVEFSETGNAAYIYERRAFESKKVTLRTPRFGVAQHLKHEGRIDRVLHQGNWEPPARQKLAELGIRP